MCLYCSNRKFYDSSHCVRSYCLKKRYFVWFILPYKQYSQMFSTFLSAFAKLPKATVSFVMSVCLSVCPHDTTRLPLHGLAYHFIFGIFFRQSVHKIRVLLQSDENKGYIT